MQLLYATASNVILSPESSDRTGTMRVTVTQTLNPSTAKSYYLAMGPTMASTTIDCASGQTALFYVDLADSVPSGFSGAVFPFLIAVNWQSKILLFFTGQGGYCPCVVLLSSTGARVSFNVGTFFSPGYRSLGLQNAQPPAGGSAQILQEFFAVQTTPSSKSEDAAVIKGYGRITLNNNNVRTTTVATMSTGEEIQQDGGFSQADVTEAVIDVIPPQLHFTQSDNQQNILHSPMTSSTGQVVTPESAAVSIPDSALLEIAQSPQVTVEYTNTGVPVVANQPIAKKSTRKKV